VSHDRTFLDKTTERTLDLSFGLLEDYPGGYHTYLKLRAERMERRRKEYEEQQAFIARTEEFIRRYGAGQRSKEAKGREKRLSRLHISDQMVDAVENQKHIRVALGTEQRAGDQVLDVRELTKAYDGRTLWRELGFQVKRGER